MGYWGVVNNCIKNSDIILLVLDARVPDETQNREVTKKAGQLNKEIVYVINKTDLVSESELKRLRKNFEKAFLVSSKQKKGIKGLKSFLEQKSKGKHKALRVAILGYPNTGKSSLLNLLVKKANFKISSVSGTTKKTEWIREKNLRFMDSPGVIPRTDSKVNVGITASKDPHKIKNPDLVALKIIKKIKSKNERILERFYNLKINEGEDDYNILLKIGEVKKYLIKGGEVDEHRTSIKIIDDWQKGKIGLKEPTKSF